MYQSEIISIYQHLSATYTTKANQLKAKANTLTFLRLSLFLGFIFLLYQLSQTGSTVFIIATIFCFAAFFVVIRWHQHVQHLTLYYTALAKYNDDEMVCVTTNKSMYDTGREYEQIQHPYSYDLDLFAEGGLFGYLNRCSTSFGKESLANALLDPVVADIAARQVAVKELAGKLSFRQQLYAHGSLHHAKQKDLERLLVWAGDAQNLLNKYVYYLLLILPAITVGALLYYLFRDSEPAFNLFSSLFVVNIIVAALFGKKITAQLQVSSAVSKILYQYKDQLKTIEAESFSSPYLKELQAQLKDDHYRSSQLLHQLATLFERLETVVNLVVSIVLNGLFLYHIHVLFKLSRWKELHATKILPFLKVIGEFESLSSFANLAYNNPGFCVPEVSKAYVFSATDLGHPLIHPDKRITNSVSFNQQHFTILTGSNMSGKSTFLRTLGVNVILAKAGAVVSASRFEFYPFKVYVSMRIADSLQESESLFYAELKRLHAIVEDIERGNHTFVILDEILRGTNSNDKRNGTIGLIEKLMRYKTYGIIATHDVIVADLKNKYPESVNNRCFESEIINDELLFDYQLKDGVCTKLSASYLMKKMGVID